MAWYDKFLKRDGSGITPTPQHFNPTADDYEPLYGRNNAGRVELYGPDGNPISTASNKLAVRAAELEALIGEVQASPTPNTLLARLKNLETKIDAITAGTSPANVQLTGSKGTLASSIFTNNLNVAPGNSVTIAIAPVAGEIWSVKNLSFFVPAPIGAGTGSHSFSIRIFYPDSTYDGILESSAVYNSIPGIKFNILFSGTGLTNYPANAAEQQRNILSTVLSNTGKLYIVYTNNTDAIQNGTLNIRIAREVKYIVA